jgi:hypothetical protein
MTPAEIIAAKYAARGECFRDVLAAHLVNGYVFSGPDYFVMGRAVGGNDSDLWLDFNHVFHVEQCDAWFISAMAGNVGAALRLIPYPLPYLVYQRRGKWRRRKVMTRTLNLQKPEPPAQYQQ